MKVIISILIALQSSYLLADEYSWTGEPSFNFAPSQGAYDVLNKFKEIIKNPPDIDPEVIWESLPKEAKEAMYYTFHSATKFGGDITNAIPFILDKMGNYLPSDAIQQRDHGQRIYLKDIPFLQAMLQTYQGTEGFRQGYRDFLMQNHSRQ